MSLLLASSLASSLTAALSQGASRCPPHLKSRWAARGVLALGLASSAHAGASVAMSASAPADQASPDAMGAYQRLKAALREVSSLSEVNGILSYDEQCFMPAGAAEARAEQKAALAK
ncbi:MAG: hypothetical protein SGPRY_008854, partial [Prymnesium sp.]